MTFTVEQKSQLAKLMATENLRVEHQKISTAKFDPKNRILYLPIWQNMSGTLYDLLCGHEVGHALYTPAEGWHDVATDKSKPKAYKHFLNVVEDARIEKKVKRRYPGLKTAFQAAYAELNVRDFFGIKNRDVNGLPFIDRLNLYTKSQYTAHYINFTAKEQLLVKKVENLETWDEVLAITSEVYEYSKDEQYEMNMHDFEEFESEYGEGDDSDFDDYDYDYDSESDEDEESKDSDSKSNSGKDEEDADGDEQDSDTETKGNAKGDAGEEEGDDEGTKVQHHKDSQPATKDMFVPQCRTDEEFRSKEDSLLDEKCKPYVYVNIPKPIFANIITPAKRVQEQLVEYYLKDREPGYSPRVSPEKSKKWVADFKNRNERYVGLLAKEFEMRKAAKAFSKSKLSDTGDIDISKLASYKFDDNIFRKVMMTPKGKNHGLILLLDKSGSMSNNMPGSIEQILILAMFCRKVNIPFIVYGFGDSLEANAADRGVDYYNNKTPTCFGGETGELALEPVFLREYINSKMSNSEFSSALRNMIILKKGFEGGRWGYRGMGRPECEHLSNTPLTQAVFACGHIMKAFRQKYNLDMSSLVIVHDGDSDWCHYMWQLQETRESLNGPIVMRNRRAAFDAKRTNVIVRDPAIKFEKRLQDDSRDAMLIASLEWFRKMTNSNVFGFFLTATSKSYINSAIYNRYVFEDGTDFEKLNMDTQKPGGNRAAYEMKREATFKKFKSEKFLASKTPGYTEFYLVLGGEDMNVGNEDLEIDGKYTASKLKNAFMKMNKKKALNRVLVSRFIQGIAA
jgi:hypothetical protein